MKLVIDWRHISAFLRRKRVQLWLVWLLGLSLGTVLAAYADPSCFSLMRSAASCRMSIVGLVASVLLPFLFSAYAVTISRPELVLGICACKAFSFAYCGQIARMAYGTAGWLVQPLLQFTAICTLPVFCGFCLRHIAGGKATARRDLGLCLGLAVLIAGVDYFVVSPFLAGLIDY